MDESENVANFCAVTDADPSVATNYLTVCEGDLERAILLYMESGGVDIGATIPEPTRQSPPSTSARTATSEVVADYDEDEQLARDLQEADNRRAARAPPAVRAPIAPRHENLLGGEDFLDRGSSALFGSGGPSSRSRARPSVFLPPDSSNLAREAFRDFAAEAAEMGGDTSPKTSRLADLFKPPLDLMARGDFEHARNIAKAETKWLLVNIQEAGVFACQILNRDLWSHLQVKEVVKENFVFLQYYSDSAEGKKYSTFYPIKDFPHIAIIDPRTGERLKSWSTAIEPVDFLSDVEEFLDMHSLTDSSKPSQAKKKKVARQVSDMTEEEQLHAALMASLGNDPSAAIEIPEVDTSTPTVVQDTPPEPEVSVFDSIQPAPHVEATDPATSTRIAFRFSDGKRSMHRFAKTESIRTLFSFIKCEVAEDRPFSLVFERKQLIDFTDKTLADLGLDNALITVEW